MGRTAPMMCASVVSLPVMLPLLPQGLQSPDWHDGHAIYF
jgi:hypothetical protein